MQKASPYNALRHSDAIEEFPAGTTRRFSIPAWAISVALHCSLLVLLALTLRLAPVGAAVEELRDVGVVLKHHSVDGDYYETKPETTQSPSDAATATDLAAAIDDTPPVDPTDVLPEAHDVIGPGSVESTLNPGSEQLTAGGQTSTAADGGQARTSVFGIEGTGFKFVYVFDCSGSMGADSNAPLDAAKAELLASLDSLGETHQFQIVFYNESPMVPPLAGHADRLVFGSQKNKDAATRFVGGIVANGSTRHEEALTTALRMRPDVIFFLTDADEPALSSRQLANIRRLNAGATINSIEFGQGPAFSSDNFLKRLARENGGRYAYIDILGWNRHAAPE